MIEGTEDCLTEDRLIAVCLDEVRPPPGLASPSDSPPEVRPPEVRPAEIRPLRFASLRFAPARSALLRSGRMSRFSRRHSFQAVPPCLSKATRSCEVFLLGIFTALPRRHADPRTG